MKDSLESRAERLAGAAREAAGGIGEAGHKAADGARSEISDFIDEVLELIGEARDWEQDEVAQLRERVQDSAQRLKDGAYQKQRELRRAAKHAAVQADGYVHDNPWQTAAIAGVLGLALGVLISRR